MKDDFLKEVLETARHTADSIFDKVEDFLNDNEVSKKEDDPLESLQAHYNDPKNGFVNNDGTYRKFGKTYRELQEEVAWLTDENADLNDELDSYKLALQVLLDGEQTKTFKDLTYTRLLNLTVPGINVRVVPNEDPATVTLTITQNS